ncbi:hypothetical protein A0H81_01684 [Grifola frondosa]|uniref:Uncharacterized protein n=1 Tax=Grifola frondosa TaxID=5627 RepID=A0A1C7MN62_GRIFR|nr:hypothetical protein A0H81_01684 [Grifola frondosa]
MLSRVTCRRSFTGPSIASSETASGSIPGVRIDSHSVKTAQLSNGSRISGGISQYQGFPSWKCCLTDGGAVRSSRGSEVKTTILSLLALLHGIWEHVVDLQIGRCSLVNLTEISIATLGQVPGGYSDEDFDVDGTGS